MNDRVNSSNFPTKGVHQSSLGMILQRGGEELCLEKVNDRFSVRLVRELSRQELSLVGWGNWHRRIPNAKLEVFMTTPNHLETAMFQGRADEEVAFVSHIYRIQNSPGTYVYLTDQITIQFAPGVNGSRINTIAATFGLVFDKAVATLANTCVFLASKQARENPIKIANHLMVLPEVIAAEPNILIQQESHYRPQDTLYSQQWYLHHNGGRDLTQLSHISVEQAWDITRGVPTVAIAVVDDSFDLHHPDFQGQGKIVAPRDLKENDFLPLPGERETSHGTACAGIALASENGQGVVGVAPGCAFMPIRTTGFLDDESIEEIFEWAIAKGANVISCSWGASAVYFPLSLRQRAAITRAATQGRNGKGCVILFAAGNANRPINGNVDESNWLQDVVKGNTYWLNGFAVHPDTIAVAASTSLNKKAAYSNWGANISVCAPSNNAPPGMWFPETGFIYTQPVISGYQPGRGMFTTDQLGAVGYNPGDFVSNFGGTSSATPVVAGVAGLILSVNPDLTASQVKHILEETADKVVDLDPDPQLGMRGGTYDKNGHSPWFGYGKVNAKAAVVAAQKMRVSDSIVTRYIAKKNQSPLEIPDNNPQGIKSAIAIAESSLVKDIQVKVHINHEFLGDLEIYLIAPNNQQILLQSRTLGRRTDLQATYYLGDKSAPTDVTTALVPSPPIFKKLVSLKASGRWLLWIIDRAPQDVGRLYSWELILGV